MDLVTLVLFVIGLVLLIVGAEALVRGAARLAAGLGISPLVIGLTVVAFGASSPELAVSVQPAFSGQADLALGSAAVSPAGIDTPMAAFDFDIPVMIAVAVACLPIFFTGYQIARWEGFVFLGYYIAYTAYLVLDAAEHDALPLFSNIMFLFVIPITALTLAVLVARAIRQQKTPDPKGL